MKLETHMTITLKKFGVEAGDIHEWIDGLFDHTRFKHFLETGVLIDGYDPYDHRVHRHCLEAENECVTVFVDTYPEETIRAVFQQHVRDDYGGHYPVRDEFDDPEFHEKHHRK